MLYGRDTELAALEQLIDGARSGRSRGLLLRGEAGIGKSTLLDRAADQAAERGVRVLRAAAVEAESDLAFAGLLQLLRPVLDRAEALPAPQAEALRSALGAGEARKQDRFLTGLAVLSLLAEVAEGGPVLCLVDDAHWVDEPSADALLFAARRLAAEGVAMVFAAREEGFEAAGIPRLELSRLAREDALLLLADLDVAPAVRDRVITESEGNPLALVEFGSAVGAEQREPHLPGNAPLPAPDRVLAAFRSRVEALPEPTRLMLLISAAESKGLVSYMLGAAESMGVGLADLADAERQGLVEVTEGRVAFRHPLIRTAVYQSAPMARRVAVHQALAATSSEPDCRATHRAAAAMGPDEEVAAELEAYADRARARGGFAAAANRYARAARLSPDPAQRVRRLTTAAWTALQAGHAEQSSRLAEEADGLTGDPAVRAELAFIRSFWLFEEDLASEAARLLLDHAPASPVKAADMLRTAATYGWFGGDVDSVRRAAVLLKRYGDGSSADGAVQGLAYVAEDDFARGLPLIAELLDDAPDDAPNRLQAISASSLIADEAVLTLVTRLIHRHRRDGRIGRLPYLLHVLARGQIYAGQHRDAEATVAEAAAIARDTGLRKRINRLDHLVARIAAIEGDEERVRRLVSTGMNADGNHGVVALALLDLGLGRYQEVLRRLSEGRESAPRYSAALIFAASDQVEAAVRLGEPERAEEPARRFAAWAAASGQPWARAVVLRNDALRNDSQRNDTSAAAHGPACEACGAFEHAVKLHLEGGRPFERARTELLFGEHLRRAKRRSDSRAQLRSALEIFERLRAAPWAERARGELRATGEALVAARAAAPSLVDRLTPQERQVVRLAAKGTSSREIAAQLFLSSRTVEYHLYKAYPKLGVSSRRELAALDLAADA
jgi:DNA-binding CsgD family transcriptional regulator